jgi:Trypsin.
MKTKIKSPNGSEKRTWRVSQNNSQSNCAKRTKQILRGVIAAFGIFCVLTTKAQSIDDTQTAPEVTVPTIVSTSSDRGDMRTRSDMVLPSMRYHLQIDVSKTSVTLAPVDVRSVELDAPNQVGINRSVSMSPKSRAQKFLNPDGSTVIVLVIKSTNAYGIGVHFRDFDLAGDDEVYVYGPASDSIVCGPFTKKGPWGSGEFWSGTITGDTAIIELYTKPGEKNRDAFEIFEISHIFAEQEWQLLTNEPEILTCERDAKCYGDLEKNAVGRILFNNAGPHVCTGTLLNDRAQNHIPYFLTANHCVPTQAVAQTVEVWWFYQTSYCNSGVLRSGIVHSTTHANLLVTQRSNDFSLLRLVSFAPGGVVFSGWVSSAQALGAFVFGLHHPGGYTPPSLYSYLRRASGNITSTNYGCSASGLVSGYGINWAVGAAEPGSSGSGLWNSNHRLVGVLSCGDAIPSCTGHHTYSKFANFYPLVRPYIYP